jgi:hypothetical protein
MIRLTCPRCLKTMSAPDKAAGKPAPCPSCGQALRVPGGLPATTLDAPAAVLVPDVPPEAAGTATPGRPRPGHGQGARA